MKIKVQKLSRTSYVVLAFAFALAGLAPVITTRRAHAFPVGGQVQNRSITISDSRISHAATTYKVSFKAATSYTIKGIIVDFCKGSNSTPIIGDSTCNTPTTFNVGGATPAFDTGTAPNNLGTNANWASTGLNNTSGNYRTVKLTNSTGVALTATTQYTFTLTNVTNPADLGTFYARIITYTADATGDITTYAPGSEGSTQAQDYGGFALTTANVISVTAKVQETLTFCVSGADLSTSGLNTDCTGATAPTITLGHGTPAVLTPGQVDRASVYTQTSTNAANGIFIRMKNLNTCANAGLSSNGGTTCNIPGQDNTAAATPMAAGTAAYGLYVADSNFNATGSGTITPDAVYHDTGHTNIGTGDLYYGMDNTTSGENVTTLYGDTIATASGPLSLVNNQLVFAATASNTTAAGIYTANMILMASGTF
ncbi:MAG TPA: hypothetical protein VLI54_03485 [Bacillota bacterium]|nr:hypothetical protein [Bacillota bacterium]